MDMVIVKFEKRRNNSYMECVINLVQLLKNVNSVGGEISFLMWNLLYLVVTWNWSLQIYGLWNHLEGMRNGLYLRST